VKNHTSVIVFNYLKTYIILDCGLQFTQKSNLNIHEKKHHELFKKLYSNNETTIEKNEISENKNQVYPIQTTKEEDKNLSNEEEIINSTMDI